MEIKVFYKIKKRKKFYLFPILHLLFYPLLLSLLIFTYTFFLQKNIFSHIQSFRLLLISLF